MAIAARNLQGEYAGMPATRVYSQTAELLRQRREEEAARLERERERRAARRKVAREAAMTRFFMIMAVGVAAAAMLVVLMRYAKITEEYAAVNALKQNIAQTQLEIQSLHVQLNGAVSLSEAQAAAEEAGLGYPTADQIVTVTPNAYTGGAVELTREAAEDLVEVLE